MTARPGTRTNHWTSLGLLACWAGTVFAHPSGGPYGPLRLTYEVPEGARRVIIVAPDGRPDAAGTGPSAPTTLEAALAQAVTGDVIVLRGGVYRTGDLEFNQGITIQPYRDEQPILKGTRVADRWRRIGGGLWKTDWSTLFPDKPDDWWRRDRFGHATALHVFNNDMVFADGRQLFSVGWEGEVDANSFTIDYDQGTVTIGVDPAEHLIEITAHRFGLHRVLREVHGKASDGKGFALRGIVLTQYAYAALEIDGHEPQGPADPSTFGKDVVGTVIEHCTLSHCGRVGAYLRGDGLVLRHCRVHDTVTEGIYLLASSDCLLERNDFSRNNIEDIAGYYPAAVKIFNQTHRVTCRDNLVHDLPLSNGIWYDVGNVDGRFLDNWVQGVGRNSGRGANDRLWPSQNGFFFEISKGAVCAGNVFIDCDHGLLILNSRDVTIAHNTFVDSTACIGRDGRSAQGDHFGWHPSTGPDVDERGGHAVLNNLFYADAGFQRPLLLVWQPAGLCERLTDSPLRQLDGNVYAQPAALGMGPVAYWSPAEGPDCQAVITTLDDLRGLFSGAARHDRLYRQATDTLFRSRILGRYEPNPAFPGTFEAVDLPPALRQRLGLPDGPLAVGAYPRERLRRSPVSHSRRALERIRSSTTQTRQSSSPSRHDHPQR